MRSSLRVNEVSPPKPMCGYGSLSRPITPAPRHPASHPPPPHPPRSPPVLHPSSPPTLQPLSWVDVSQDLCSPASGTTTTLKEGVRCPRSTLPSEELLPETFQLL
jgi:hypothetical protein